MRFATGAMIGAALVLAGCTQAPPINNSTSAASLPVNAGAETPVPTGNEAVPAAPLGNGAAPAVTELSAFVVGRWVPQGSDCSRAVEFRADGAAIRAPGAQADRWTLEGETGNRGELVINEQGGRVSRIAIVRAGANMGITDERNRPLTLTRC